MRRHPGLWGWRSRCAHRRSFVENYGGTTLTLRSRPVNATESERKVFEAGHDSMRGGFGGTFEQLERHLAGN
jgi:hypothetical protein